jgi:hypothetical protein
LAERSFDHLLHFVFQKDCAVTAEPVEFAIDIPNTPTVVHDAGLIRTVPEVEGMTQFMDCLLFDSAPKCV